MNKETTVIATREILGRTVQVYGSFEEPLFLAKDVAAWIGHTNPIEMIQPLKEGTEKLNSAILSSGQLQIVSMLTEDGLYEVLMLSQKPIAKDWKKGVKMIIKG